MCHLLVAKLALERLIALRTRTSWSVTEMNTTGLNLDYPIFLTRIHKFWFNVRLVRTPVNDRCLEVLPDRTSSDPIKCRRQGLNRENLQDVQFISYASNHGNKIYVTKAFDQPELRGHLQ